MNVKTSTNVILYGFYDYPKHWYGFLRRYCMKSLSIIPLALFLQLISLFAAPGCTKQGLKKEELGMKNLATDSLSKTWLALGDSYTIGESVAVQERFPAQTVALLKAHGVAVSEPQYIARTGWTTADLQNAISKAILKPKYDIVSLLIGVNDQYQGLDTTGYRTRFTQLLQKAILLAGNEAAHVFIVSIPDYGVTPFGGGSAKISKEIDDFNAINKQVTLAYKVSYTDITPISREAAGDQSLTAGDGLHPSGKQYKRWAEILEQAMLAVVK